MEDTILDYLQRHAQGKQNGVKARTLKVLFKVTEREVRDVVNTLRAEGYPICSGNQGYYFAATEDELKVTIQQLRSRVNQINNAIHGLSSGEWDFNCSTL